MMKLFRRPIVGVALSGGGARGLAHIGVLKVLEREGITIDCMGGTSMGGLVGAAYATGKSPAQIEEIALKMAKLKATLKLIDLRKRRSLFGGGRVRSWLADLLGAETTFNDLVLPFLVNAVDIRSGKEVVLNTGRLVDAVRSTISVPAVFDPVEMNEWLLVDGGVLNNLPVDHVKALGAEVLVAVRLGMDTYNLADLVDRSGLPAPAAALLAMDSLVIGSMTDARLKITKPNVLIQPNIPKGIMSLTGFTRATELIKCGEEAAEKALPQLRTLVSPKLTLVKPRLRTQQEALAKPAIR